MKLGYTKLQLSHQPLKEKSKFSYDVISCFLNFFFFFPSSDVNILANRYFWRQKWRGIWGVANRETSSGNLCPEWVGTNLNKTRTCNKNEERTKCSSLSLIPFWNESQVRIWVSDVMMDLNLHRCLKHMQGTMSVIQKKIFFLSYDLSNLSDLQCHL